MTGHDDKKRKCTRCGGSAVLTSSGKVHGSTWRCSKCGHTMGVVQQNLGGLS